MSLQGDPNSKEPKEFTKLKAEGEKLDEMARARFGMADGDVINTQGFVRVVIHLLDRLNINQEEQNG